MSCHGIVCALCGSARMSCMAHGDVWDVPNSWGPCWWMVFSCTQGSHGCARSNSLVQSCHAQPIRSRVPYMHLHAAHEHGLMQPTGGMPARASAHVHKFNTGNGSAALTFGFCPPPLPLSLLSFPAGAAGEVWHREGHDDHDPLLHRRPAPAGRVPP